MRRGTKKLITLILLALLPLCEAAYGRHITSDDASANMPKPWTFWYWMYGAVSKPGIQADLIGMKKIGLGGCYLMPIRGVNDKPEYQGEAQQLSPKFWEMVDYAFSEADSLGLQMGIHICDGFALAGGPWITPEQSMKKVVWTDTVVAGHRAQGTMLRQPDSYGNFYRDIATFAIQLKKSKNKKLTKKSNYQMLLHPKEITWSENIHQEKGVYKAALPGYIQYEFDKAVTVRSLQIVNSGNNIQAERLNVMASDDGIIYYDVKQLMPPRQGWQNTSADYTFALPTTKARFFRFYWTPDGTEPGSEELDAAKWKPVLKLKDIRLYKVPQIDQYEGKSAAVWRIDANDNTYECYPVTDVKLLARADGDSSHSCNTNRLTDNLPNGVWRIIRMGYTSTGQINATAGGGKGLECDKFSPEAVRTQFAHWYQLFTERPHSNVIRYLHVDSWECGCQNWSENFAKEFKQHRGYDVVPYLPLLAGIPIESVEKSEQVLRDFRSTVNDLINEKFFGTVRDLAHQYGKELTSESVAPTMVSDGISHYQYADVPMGEYWLNSPTHDKPNDMLDAVSGAHIYHKNIIQAEGFTEVRGVWNETPAMLKPLLDRNFALGMNQLVFHVDVHNPWMDRRPGMTLDGIGLFFQRDNTWYHDATGLVNYVQHCQSWLQKGEPVADIAVFTDEEMPCRSLTPDKLVTMLPGLMGTERVNQERKRLKNEGQPMVESPVGVMHSAGILDLKDWINPLHGYQYDSMNRDILLQCTASNGYLSLPGIGPKYRVLVLPLPMKGTTPVRAADYLSEAVRQKIEDFRRAGVCIIDTPYTSCDLTEYGIKRDVELPEGVAYTHRYDAADSTDIYFIANQQDTVRQFTALFRNGQQVAIRLPQFASTFVIFRKGAATEITDTYPEYRDSLVLRGKWQRTMTGNFSQKGANKGIGLVNLVHLPDDWTKCDSVLSYYSGTMSYTTTFNWQRMRKLSHTVISLGNVCDVAHVYLNGVDCGVAWTAPYELDISHVLKTGVNVLRIEVTNTWHNALLGENKSTIWTNANYRMKERKLLPAGLLGPVSIKYEP